MSKDTPTNEMFEAFQKMINPMAFPMQNLLMGGMKLEEVERKISELRTVHHWLSTNLGMLDLSIKTLEYQATLLQPATRDGAASASDAAASAAQNPFLNPSLWPWPYGQAGAPEVGPDDAPAAAKARPAAASSSSSTGTGAGGTRKGR